MVPSEMEDGLCLLDVIGDPNLLNEFLETEGGSGSTAHSQALAAAAQAQAEAQVQASTDAFQLNGTPLEPGVSDHNGGFLAPSTTLTSSQSSGASNHRSVTPISSETSNFIQTVHRQSTQSPRNGSPLMPTNTHMIVNSLTNNHIQYVAGRRSASPATGQVYSSASSPLLARTRTPNQSPVPTQTNVGSPMFAPNQALIKVSRSVTPSQQSITPSISPAPGINVNTFQLQTSMQPSLPVANTMQIQGIIQTPGTATQAQFSGQTGQQFIQQKTVVQSHPNLVQAQPQQVIHSQPAQTVLQNIQNQNLLQAIQQNPALLQSLGYNTGAVSTTQQVKPSSPGVNLYSTVQGSVQNPVGLQGTIIQTAQGKSILFPNNMSGKPLTVAGLQNLQPIAVRPPMNLQPQANQAGIATINSLQGQPTNQVGQPQISVLNINPQAQQFVIQRASGPGHPQNIIVRTIPQNFIQLQAPGGQTSQISTSQSQILSQISQNPQIINSQSQGSIPLQPLLNSSQGQQISILNQHGLQVNPQGTVTLNIANQNVNLSQVGSSGNFQPTQIQAGPHRSLPNQHVIQPQSTTTLPVISQHSIQTNQQTSTLTQSKSSKKSNKKAQAAANKAQQLAAASSRQGIQVIRPANQTIISAQTSSQTGLQPTQLQTQQINSIGNSDSINVKNPHMMFVQSSNSGVNSGHISGGMNVSSINYSTANTTPVTTTVTHSAGPMVSHVSLSNSIYSAPLSSSSVLASPQVSVLNGSVSSDQTSHQQGGVVTQLSSHSTSTNANVQSNPLGRTQPPLQFQTIQLSQQDHQTLQRIQLELKPFLEQKPQTPEQTTRMQKLILLHKQILNKGKQQQLALTTQQSKIGQQIVTKDQQGSVIINQALPQTTVQAGTTEIQIPSQPAQNIISGNLSHALGQNQTVVKLDVKPGSVVQGQLVNQKGVLSNQVIVPSVSANAPPGKLPISASPAVPTQLKIGTHLVTLNLTPQNKEKLVSQLGKMTPEQQQLFYKHQYATIQKLQQQHQIQQQIQAAQLRKQVKAAEGKLPTILQAGEKAIHIKPSESHTSPGRATKRPAAAEICKGSLLHQQLARDQEKGLNPEAKTPFKSVKDACQRLLRYHVFQSPGPSTKDFNKVDGMFEHISGDLLKKRDQMFAKYQLLLLEESMREKSTAEMVMIERLMTQDLTDVIEKERQQVDEDPDSFESMPAKYLKMSPKLKQEPRDSVSPEAIGKSEVTGCETPVDVEHGSSPENPLDMAKSPVRSVMSSSGFKLFINKKHALSISSDDTSSEKKVHVASKRVNENIKKESDDMLTSSDYKPPVLDSVSNSPKFGNSSLISNIKTEPDYGFTRSDSIQEVPVTPFKNFSGESHPHDVFFNDSGPCSPEEGNEFSFHGNSFSKNIQESSVKVKQEIIHCVIDDISSDNLPDMEDSSLPKSEHVSLETEGKRSRINSETDAALEGLLNCSNTGNLDSYQFDPDDFKPVGNPTDMTEEEFDISDPFDENGDFFGYGNHYTMGSESSAFEQFRQDTASSVLSDKVNSIGGGSASGNDQQIGLVGQYEAISPVSDHSGGFNEDLPSSSENNLMRTRDYSSFFSQTNQRSMGLSDGMRDSPQPHSLFSVDHSVGQTGVSRETENAVDSIMEFGGCGDQPFSSVIVNDQSNTRPASRIFSNNQTQDLKSRSVKAANRRDMKGGGDSLEEKRDFLFHNEDNESGHNNSNPVLKEQMESAINSILSPVSSDHQGSPFPLDEYDFEEYSGYNNSHQTTVMEQQTTEDSAEGSQDQSGIEDDLDAAINSILI